MCFLALFSAVGFTNGSVRILDGLMLKEEGRGDGLAVFSHCHDCVTNIKFSHDSRYLATSVSKLLSNRMSLSESVTHSLSQSDTQSISQPVSRTDRQRDSITSRTFRLKNMTSRSKISARALLFPLKIELIRTLCGSDIKSKDIVKNSD